MKITTLASGSSGNAIYLGDKETNILVDCGLTGKKTSAALAELSVDPGNLAGIVITHEHRDHIQGIGIMSRKYDIPVFATEKTWAAIDQQIGELAEKNQRYLAIGEAIELGSIQLEPFATSHDAAEPIGIAAYQGEEKVGIATDTGCVTPGMNKHLQDCDLILLEANHDEEMLQQGPYPIYLKKRIKSNYGHLSNHTTGKALAKWVSGNTQQVILAHLSQENNQPYLARKTVEEILLKEGVGVGMEVQVTVAPREEAHPLVERIDGIINK